ncbi:MAG TPA: serine hydrolase, partial [Thermoanaerobaculia bacterium]|nr:serine hydrolase [Thermoanaerobaculia bacterium]
MLAALAFVALREIDQTIQRAIAQHNIPGAVYRLEHRGKVYEKAYGDRALVPRRERMTRDTIFDAASLTKVVATAPSIWLLIERGKIELDAPLNRYLKEARGDITIRQLLTHTSGLRPDLDLGKPWSGYESGMAMAVAEEPVNRPGFVFRYSDINYELLGEVVRRVSGEPLDVFARREIFEQLKMRDTHFRPERDVSRIAPTEFADGVMLRGVVHDPTARRMGGVAGHAGLFTTVGDLAKFARMLLRGGAPIFKRETVRAMTSVQTPPNLSILRAGGFDIDSSYSRPRGTLFPVGSYGHTGFTGTILWIDPASKTFYIFLSNRVHPNGKGDVRALQAALGTASARAAGLRVVQPQPRVGWVTRGDDVFNGIDTLVAERFAPLRGMKIGVITNHSGIDRAGNLTIDVLRSAPGVDVRAIFAPEHGLFGTADANLGDMRDPVRGLPVYSLYGESRKPAPAQLAGLDALVFDIQDVGVRFYTYVATMRLAMEAAAEAKIKFIVLNRVNPIGGVAVEG